MNNDIYRRTRIVAALLTLLIAGLIVVFLVVSTLESGSLGSEQQAATENAEDEEDDIIFLDPEFLTSGDEAPEPAADPAPIPVGLPAEAEEPNERPVVKADNPKPNNSAEKLITQKAESPVTTVTPSKRDEEEAEVSSRMKNKFNAKNGQSGGKGSQVGSGGSGSGASGRLPGRTFLGCPQPVVEVPRSVSIVVNVTVDASGRVTAASFASDSGPGAGNIALRNACVRQSRSARWSAKEGAPPAKGTLTWHLLPK